MGKETERTFCNYIEDGVTWLWRTKPSRKNAAIEERDCVINCSGNEVCYRMQKPGWPGRGIEGAKPDNHCPICEEGISCEPLCF